MKLIQYLVLVLLFLSPISSTLLAQDTNAIDKYFQQYVDDDRFTVVYISPKLFELLGKLDLSSTDLEEDEAEVIMEMVKDLKGLRILVSEEDTETLYKEAKQKINTSDYEVLMTVKDKDGDNVDFLIKDQNDGSIITELFLLVGGDESFVMMSFVGNIDMEKVSKLAKAMEE